MSTFNIAPKAAPTTLNPGPNGSMNTEAAMSPRERAIAKLNSLNAKPAAPAVNAQAEAVRNPSSVSPEELSAVKAPSVGESRSSEAPASEKPAAESLAPSEEPLSAQYAALARREKAAREAARARSAELKAAQDALKAQEEALKAREAEYSSKYVAKDAFQADPLKALTDAGLSYDQITEMLLNQSNAPTNPVYDRTIAQLNAKIAELEAKTTSATKLIEDREVQARQQAVNQIKADVNKLVLTDPAFETIKAMGQSDEVVRLIEETFDKEGVLMTVEEAAQEIENYLVEEIYNAAAKSSKVKSRLQPVSAPLAQKQIDAAPAASSNNQLKTLTNSVGSNRQLSARERALMAFRGEKV